MSAENTYPAMRSDDTGMKLLALFRYWNIVKYFYPYKDITGENWDDVLREMLPQFVVGSDRANAAQSPIFLFILSLLSDIKIARA
ncbi:MAG: hypothetical protein EOM30_10355 [Clostridia bacterium]|nr:hypothetical protein [Clostridia bacterium]